MPLVALRFPLGRTLVTAAASEVLPDNVVAAAILRHGQGDWGKIGPEDAESNEYAVTAGDRIMSVYDHDDRDFWIITEGEDEHRVTTVLLPSDY